MGNVYSTCNHQTSLFIRPGQTFVSIYKNEPARKIPLRQFRLGKSAGLFSLRIALFFSSNFLPACLSANGGVTTFLGLFSLPKRRCEDEFVLID
jgi:hypothetical protein